MHLHGSYADPESCREVWDAWLAVTCDGIDEHAARHQQVAGELVCLALVRTWRCRVLARRNTIGWSKTVHSAGEAALVPEHLVRELVGDRELLPGRNLRCVDKQSPAGKVEQPRQRAAIDVGHHLARDAAVAPCHTQAVALCDLGDIDREHVCTIAEQGPQIACAYIELMVALAVTVTVAVAVVVARAVLAASIFATECVASRVAAAVCGAGHRLVDGACKLTGRERITNVEHCPATHVGRCDATQLDGLQASRCGVDA